MPPLTLLTGEPPDWSDERNRMLAVALTVMEAEVCSCGTPSWIGQSSDRNIIFDVDSTVCHGCAEMERYEESDRRTQKKKVKGESLFVVPRNVWPDEPLPSRADYYTAMMEKGEG